MLVYLIWVRLDLLRAGKTPDSLMRLVYFGGDMEKYKYLTRITVVAATHLAFLVPVFLNLWGLALIFVLVSLIPYIKAQKLGHSILDISQKDSIQKEPSIQKELQDLRILRSRWAYLTLPGVVDREV